MSPSRDLDLPERPMLVLERAYHFQPEPVESGHYEVAYLALFSVPPHCRDRDRLIDHDIVPGDGTEKQHVEILLRLTNRGVRRRGHLTSPSPAPLAGPVRFAPLPGRPSQPDIQRYHWCACCARPSA